MKSLLSPEEYARYPVLYVDDEPLALETFKVQFGEHFTIHTARSGEEALDIIAAKPVSVLLSDQRMPGMSGVELLSRVKASHPDTIRVLITAYSDMDVVIEAINAGNVYRYVTKPYNEDEVRSLISQGIETRYLMEERSRLEAEKLENAKRMALANRLSAVGTLAAGMAHEINNPLTAVSAFLQMLPGKLAEKKRDQEFFEPFYQKVCEELERIQKLIAGLLRYSKYGDQEAYRFKETNLNEMLEDIVTLLKPEARKRGNRVDVKMDPGLPGVFVDPDRMKQVFMNLFLNALQATRKGRVTVRSESCAEKDGSPAVRVSVEDTGSGISKENLSRVFDPFFTTKQKEGSGLGLLTCHQIVEAHRGAIRVRSMPKKGTTFSVQIPQDPRPPKPREASPEKEAEPAST